MDIRIGKGIKNNNGTTYTVLAINGDRALLHGGYDFVVINDLSYFEQSGSWGGGKYFPCFHEEDSSRKLKQALSYFRYEEYCVNEEED